MDFCLQVFAKRFGDDAGGGEFTQVGNGELGEVGEDGCERGVGVADERQADVVGAGPFAVLSDGQDYVGRKIVAGEDFQDLGFGEMGVIEHDGEDLRMAFGQERSRDAGRSAASESDFLTERKMREAGEELFFGDASQVGGRARTEGELGQVHQVKFADEAEAGKSRRAGVEGQSALDWIILEQRLAADDFFEDFGGEIFAGENQAQLRFVEGGIVEQREQHGSVGMVKQHGEVVAGGDQGAFAILRKGVHDKVSCRLFSPDCPDN
jgi:hypothetical protein